MNKLTLIKYRSAFWQTLVFAAIMGYLFGSHSCANPGVGPQGGPRDSIPPVILSSTPQPFQTNYTGNEISLVFNEFVVAENLAAKMVVSPPLAEKMNVKMRGKSIVIKFNEKLAEGRTYSVDFKDIIKDYNEGNKLDGFRMLFSTYDQIDTLRISGYLLDAFNHEPVENAMATLYATDNDTLFTTAKPDYIARTDAKGYFMFDNLSEGNYRLYGITDSDNNLFFSRKDEKIAFVDTLLSPTAIFIERQDTLISNGDTTLVMSGQTEYLPSLMYAFFFLHEEEFKQKINYSRRESENYLMIAFNEQLTDSFKIELLGFGDIEEPYYKEFSKTVDSVFVWLTAPEVIKTDSLLFKLSYTVTDSLDNFVVQTDTINMVYAPPRGRETPRKYQIGDPGDDEEVKLFKLTSNLSASNFDLNKQVTLSSPKPLPFFDNSKISLSIVVNDSVNEAVEFKLIEQTKRKFVIDYKLKEETTYLLKVDSAVVANYYGEINEAFEMKFKTQKQDYYGTAIFEITGIEPTAIIQLLKHAKDEEVLEQVVKPEGVGKVSFSYLKPGNYRVKLIEDSNNNGKWDTGNLNKNIQPERVYYFPKVINIKSNWDLKENWDIVPGYFNLKEFEEAGKK